MGGAGVTVGEGKRRDIKGSKAREAKGVGAAATPTTARLPGSAGAEGRRARRRRLCESRGTTWTSDSGVYSSSELLCVPCKHHLANFQQ